MIGRSLVVLGLLIGPASAQVALTPQWDVKTQQERISPADRQKAQQSQSAPWVKITEPCIPSPYGCIAPSHGPVK